MKKIKPVHGWLSLSAYETENEKSFMFAIFKDKESADFIAGFGKTIKVKITPVKRRKKK